MHLHTILSLESTCIIIPHHFISQMCNKTFLQYQPAILHPPCVDPTWNGPKISWNHICTRCMPGLVALCPGYPCCCSLLFAFLSFFFFTGLAFRVMSGYVFGEAGVFFTTSLQIYGMPKNQASCPKDSKKNIWDFKYIMPTPSGLIPDARTGQRLGRGKGSL